VQDLKELAPGDPAEAMTARGYDTPSEVDIDVIPVREVVGDALVRFRVCRLQVCQRLVGEDDAPAERVIPPVAFEYCDMMRRIRAFHQKRQIEAGRTAADCDNAQSGFVLEESTCTALWHATAARGKIGRATGRQNVRGDASFCCGGAAANGRSGTLPRTINGSPAAPYREAGSARARRQLHGIRFATIPAVANHPRSTGVPA
jgi:hypothetical protein